jgi:hypothetical protein
MPDKKKKDLPEFLNKLDRELAKQIKDDKMMLTEGNLDWRQLLYLNQLKTALPLINNLNFMENSRQINKAEEVGEKMLKRMTGRNWSETLFNKEDKIPSELKEEADKFREEFKKLKITDVSTLQDLGKFSNRTSMIKPNNRNNGPNIK